MRGRTKKEATIGVAMRRIRPIKTEQALEELLMQRLAADPVCANVSSVVIKRLARSGRDVPNWDATYFRHGGLTLAAVSAAQKISLEASAVFDLEE
jgi:hypothetical protein